MRRIVEGWETPRCSVYPSFTAYGDNHVSAASAATSARIARLIGSGSRCQTATSRANSGDISL